MFFKKELESEQNQGYVTDKNGDIIILERNWLDRDIMLLGSLLYEMVTLDNPWKKANYPIELGNEVFYNKEQPPIPAHYSPFLKNLVRMCLNIPTQENILNID